MRVSEKKRERERGEWEEGWNENCTEASVEGFVNLTTAVIKELTRAMCL